ncbi:MAG TPA: FkbM family methyltransferase [Pyrinomonadaceae bacterium]|jgi:FkbM family methyltransferase|nr:FkbM family methyltransferase [Pyrinomonadaceae bacterium]
MLKKSLKDALLRAGLYYKLNNYRFRDAEWGGRREAAQKSFYARLIESSDTVFDVGANVGQRTQIFAQLAHKVIAVEPQKECIRHLRSRFMFTKNVLIEAVALGDHTGEASIRESDSHTISSMSERFIETVGKSRFRESSWEREAKVLMTTLDELIDKHGRAKFIKIDVEGYEAQVLSGLNYSVPYISFEFTPELIDEAEKCVARLHAISEAYLFNYCLGENLNFVLEKHVTAKEMSDSILPALSRQGNFGDVYAIHQ